MTKDQAEIDALAAAGAAVDKIAGELQRGEIDAGRPHRGAGVGRTEPPDRRRGPRQGELRHRRRRRERGEPAPPRERSGDPARTRSCCATSAARWPATAPTPRGACSPARSRPTSPRRTPCCSRRRRSASPAGTAGTPCEDVDRATRRGHRRRRATASTSSTAPATASGWRSTRIRTSSRATRCRSRPGHAYSVEPGIYIAGQVGDAARGHRRGHRRRPGVAEQLRSRPHQRVRDQRVTT